MIEIVCILQGFSAVLFPHKDLFGTDGCCSAENEVKRNSSEGCYFSYGWIDTVSGTIS